jgi:serine/threonine protein phosphatase PrpC
MARPAYAIQVLGREDRAAVFERREGLLVVIADGAGGTGGGATAAQTVIDAVALAPWHRDEIGWASELKPLDARIHPGETTALVIAIARDRLLIASVGDSEAWLFTTGDAQALTEGQRRKPLLGSTDAAVTSRSIARTGAATLIAGSDALWKYVSAEKIREASRLAPAPATEALVESARLPRGGFQDDLAIVVVSLARAYSS